MNLRRQIYFMDKVKKVISFRLSEETIELLKKLAEKDSRSATNMLEVLVRDAAEKKGIKTD